MCIPPRLGGAQRRAGAQSPAAPLRPGQAILEQADVGREREVAIRDLRNKPHQLTGRISRGQHHEAEVVRGRGSAGETGPEQLAEGAARTPTCDQPAAGTMLKPPRLSGTSANIRPPGDAWQVADSVPATTGAMQETSR